MSESSYPNDWDEVERGAAEGSRNLKIVAGKPVRVHFVQGPLAAVSTWAEGFPGKDGKTYNKKIVLPKGAQLPGYKLKREYNFEVVVLDGPEKGKHKILSCGQMIADDLLKVKKAWGEITTPDVILERTGATQNDTRYSAQGVPSTVKPEELSATFDLSAEVTFATKEDLDKLPPPALGLTEKPTSSSLERKASSAQHKMISDLASTKDLAHSYVTQTIARKFNKQELDDLTVAEASELITTLKGA